MSEEGQLEISRKPIAKFNFLLLYLKSRLSERRTEKDWLDSLSGLDLKFKLIGPNLIYSSVCSRIKTSEILQWKHFSIKTFIANFSLKLFTELLKLLHVEIKRKLCGSSDLVALWISQCENIWPKIRFLKELKIGWEIEVISPNLTKSFKWFWKARSQFADRHTVVRECGECSALRHCVTCFKALLLKHQPWCNKPSAQMHCLLIRALRVNKCTSASVSLTVRLWHTARISQNKLL